jgi:alpha-N-arabinofuranosidase
MPLDVTATGFGALRLHEALQLHHPDLKAVNTKQDPDQVKPAPAQDARVEGEHLRATLSPVSWTMLRLDTTL